MLAHVHIMKTAGQTVCDILRNTFAADHCDLRVGDLATAEDIRFAKAFYPELKSIAGHAVRPRKDLLQIEGIRFFAFLRDPVARCISHYQFEKMRNGRDVEFLAWLHQNRNYQTRILCGSSDPKQAIEVLQKHVGFVGLVEDFDRSLQLLRNWSGYDLVIRDYQSRNIAGDKTIARQITSNPVFLREMKQANAADEVVYQYVKDSIFPRQLENYSDPNPHLVPYPIAPTDIAWGMLKRNLLYKPVAKVRQRIRRAA